MSERMDGHSKLVYNKATRTIDTVSKPREKKVEAHVYMEPSIFQGLLETAKRESRSVNKQIEHYIKRGLAQDQK